MYVTLYMYQFINGSIVRCICYDYVQFPYRESMNIQYNKIQYNFILATIPWSYISMLSYERFQTI